MAEMGGEPKTNYKDRAVSFVFAYSTAAVSDTYGSFRRVEASEPVIVTRGD